MGNSRLLSKWAVVIAAALFLVPLAADWVAPGVGTQLAVAWLEGAATPQRMGLFPLWGWLVGLVGKDVAALGWISVGAGLVCVWLVASIFGDIFGAAVRLAKAGGVKGEEKSYAWVVHVAILFSGLAFALTPGFLRASTRIGPLMVALVPPLCAAWLVVRLVFDEGDTVTTIRRARVKWPLVLLALGLLAYSTYELFLAWRVFVSLAFPAVWVWGAVGVAPAVLIAGCIRKRWLSGRIGLCGAFGDWALAIVVMGALAFNSGKLDEGRVASRIVSRIIVNAEAAGRVAVVSDGMFDNFYFFMLPEKIRLISIARERDPAYGRELSKWVRGQFKRGDSEDLVFAAELGPRALIDEWTKLDKPGFAAAVATTENDFPTREKWSEACGELETMRAEEPLAGYLRHFLAVCGNALGCQMIERGDLKDAWFVFKTIVDTVEPENYGAFFNLHGMIQRGFVAPKHEVEGLAARRQLLEKSFRNLQQVRRAARSSGRLYIDPKKAAKYEQAKRELQPEAQAFNEIVAAAPKDAKSGKAAQEAIHKALHEGKVKIEAIGGRLIAIDLALGDLESAEKDAIEVLKHDRHDPTANATIGSLAGARGDHERAERYLRRALATGKASIGAKNDLAWALYRLGRLDEAETFSREAVKAYGESATIRETLAAILISKGKLDEGERELAKAEELTEKAGIPKGKIARLEIDRARLLKAKGDLDHFRELLRQLKKRTDLTEEQRAEINGLDS